MKEIIKALQPVSKSIAAALAGALVMFLAKHNIVIADDLNDALEILIGTIITGAAVYLAPKNVGDK
jgi:hypothetical protein